MAIKYYKLYDILKRKGLKTKDLIKTPENPEGILSPARGRSAEAI